METLRDIAGNPPYLEELPANIKARISIAPNGVSYWLYSKRSWGKVQWGASAGGPWTDSIVAARTVALLINNKPAV